jgi:hypothetical protein
MKTIKLFDSFFTGKYGEIKKIVRDFIKTHNIDTDSTDESYQEDVLEELLGFLKNNGYPSRMKSGSSFEYLNKHGEEKGEPERGFWYSDSSKEHENRTWLKYKDLNIDIFAPSTTGDSGSSYKNMFKSQDIYYCEHNTPEWNDWSEYKSHVQSQEKMKNILKKYGKRG